MLVLSRFEGQKIIVGDDVVIKVIGSDHEATLLEIVLPEEKQVTCPEYPEVVYRDDNGRVTAQLRYGDSILIDQCIEVRVVELRGVKVRLGFEAPRNVPVHREEVYVAIKREQRERFLQENSLHQAQ